MLRAMAAAWLLAVTIFMAGCITSGRGQAGTGGESPSAVGTERAMDQTTRDDANNLIEAMH